MPCANIHLHLADEALTSWRTGSAPCPFDLEAPAARAAFLHGALAPDWGYIPGVDRFYSELAHYVDTADLTRSILAFSTTNEQLAFAWGWVAHVLADIAIHPLVGQACGEYLYGDRELRLNSGEDVFTHVALEIGLDIVILHRQPGISSPPRAPYLAYDNVDQLLSALRATYGLDWEADRLIADHKRAMRMTSGWRPALSVIANRRGMRNGRAPDLRSRFTDATLGTAAKLLRGGTPLAGFLSPIRPPEWLVEEASRVADGFAALLQEQVSNGVADLANYNLESGVRDGSGVHHPEQEAVRWKLKSATARKRRTPLRS